MTEKLLCSTCAAGDAAVDNSKRVLPDADAAGAPGLVCGSNWQLEMLPPETEIIAVPVVEEYYAKETVRMTDPKTGMVTDELVEVLKTRSATVPRRQVKATKFSVKCEGTLCGGANAARWKKVTP